MAEPWLSGTLGEYHAVVRAVLHGLQQAHEDIEEWTDDLVDEEIWARPSGLAPVGFQMRHIAGSIDRLLTYAKGEQLSGAQLAALKSEMEPGAGRGELMAEMEQAFAQAAAVVRSTDPSTLTEARGVGRKALPTTVGGLLIHTAEHTQRHVGQLIVTVRVLRGLR
ncbi:DinB family protein [uncultured Paludibaculum sp.]|uniref:DinB family protein n=1 Tax=uncultured Paludibaculum sp. TaxID=1765020 RepID=UPI002AABC267|nr:DinB family protein [uncultured Paludibaculum sp.]